RIVIPRYRFISTRGMKRHPAPLGVPLGSFEEWCAVFETKIPGTDVPVYLLEHLGLFDRDYVYAGPGGIPPSDNLLRFAFLSRGALQLCKYLTWMPDIVHAHDWPAALVPVYLNELERSPKSERAQTASVLTIHNLAHQGVFHVADFADSGLSPGLL